ncbi:MAG: methyltransferase, TrmH family, group 3 [Phycisphaerales bacterium]|jgi:23S rRNA (guanosine2251-2'-O)-methyltransferase|nr:methyltransferase, TrmH family, group 3 [Phycisphaerales bacterium]
MEHLEGRQSILAALQGRQRRFQVILLRQGAHEEKFQDVLALAAERGVPVRRVEGRELDDLAHGATHGGMLAIVSAKPRTTPAELMALLDTLREPPLLLLLEGVEDARNLGFTLRSAEALGVHAVLIKKHLWDFDPIEIARPASGAYERMPLVQIEDVQPLQQLRQRGLRLLGCIAGVRSTIYQTDLAAGSIIAIGGEKRGLSGAVRNICDAFMTVPSRPGAASLSLSHAASIIMGEAMRQRLARSPYLRPTEARENDPAVPEGEG